MLRMLLETDGVVVIADLADRLNLTPRQINYGLKGVRQWLGQRNIDIHISPGIGIDLSCTAAERSQLLAELQAGQRVDLILTAGQRHQLIALTLLRADQPLNLINLQNDNQVSRSTILKDMERVEAWLKSFDLTVERRPNYGIWISGSEHKQRQALTALLWGEVPFEDPIWSVNQAGYLEFTLIKDVELMPILKVVHGYLNDLYLDVAMDQVAFAEADIGGRFTDHEVWHLALAFAIQFDQIARANRLSAMPGRLELIAQFEDGAVWNVARNMLLSQFPALENESPVVNYETAAITIHLLSSAKNDRWPSDSETERSFEKLISKLLRLAAEAYEMPTINYDATLRDGLIANLVPAYLRNLFELWAPTPNQINSLSSEKYAFEYEVANALAEEISRSTGIHLPEHDINNLVLLLRAAYIRERPHELKDVLVVCPSGMATAQLLVARLKARFPRLGHLTVISLRELTASRQKLADLIITTVPLETIPLQVKVIQVHPLLLPEDINAITNWLAQ
ncbi:MAG: helix-turn-helix domain-containing protein [Ardenticatenaceae bacterium]|nr:helix-turn-helix domain-containing protein [Ardenticatenaceae bacterium]